MGHDVIEDRYARLYEQPFQLAKLGNHVLGVCLSYRECTSKDEFHHTDSGSLRWIGISAGKYRQSLFLFPFDLLKIAYQFKPDIIVGASDCLHVILGQWVAKKMGCTYAADLYDDFETFGLAKIPFVKMLYKKALRKSAAISCVSKSLSSHIKTITPLDTEVISLPSTINQSIFYPRNKIENRKLLNLPLDALIVGTAGGLSKEKGIETVYNAFNILVETNPNLICVVAGSLDSTCPVPIHDRILYLGKLTHEKVAELFCSLDVGIVYLRDTKYGQLSFPQKAYEMAACKIPMVVASIGDMQELFSSTRNECYMPDDCNSLVSAVTKQLETPSYPDLLIEDWATQSKKLETTYRIVIQQAN
ncbi:hypothetical protein GCM10011613_03080 [Cellvibrio zantedeschiae]|uniref:Glycosyltransferase n=2 Tax=Cellvibrio zantedeschiae TaxID=1237077 RepID=A0ABQ3AP90_9GAMM|nr:hypothetical protein GCM10011613_03080 [Cellvibrio zantedeschiae]